MSRTADIRVPQTLVEAAVKSLFGSDVVVENPSEAEKHRDIDYIVRTADGRRVSIDLKVRRASHQRLVVEVDVLNNEKRRPWIQSSAADYLLFAHISDDCQKASFYLVRRADLQKLVKQKAPATRRAYVHDYRHVSIMYFYEYDEVASVVKLYQVTVSAEKLASNHA